MDASVGEWRPKLKKEGVVMSDSNWGGRIHTKEKYPFAREVGGGRGGARRVKGRGGGGEVLM